MSSSSDLNSIHNPISYTLPVKPIQSSLAPTDVRKQNQLNHNHNLQQAFQFSFQHQNQTHMNYNHPNYSSRSSSASSSSRNHPSPATSSGASSHASSLRTPPDLLLNPHSSSSASSSIAGTPYLGFKHGMTGNGFEKVQADPPRWVYRNRFWNKVGLEAWKHWETRARTNISLNVEKQFPLWYFLLDI